MPVSKPTDTLRLINDINRQINSSVAYKKAPGWQLNDLRDGGEGDCDSIAWTKYNLLKEQGVDPGNMSFVSMKMPDGQDHLVLRALEDGKYHYLDNRTDVIWNDAEGPITGVFYEKNLQNIKDRQSQQATPAILSKVGGQS